MIDTPSKSNQRPAFRANLSVPVRNILVVPRRKLGDLILATPLIEALRRSFPDAHLDVCVNDYNAPVVADHPHVHRLCVVQRWKFACNPSRQWAAPFHSLFSIWKMRRTGYDLMILCDPHPRKSALSLIRLIKPRHSVCCSDRAHIGRAPVDTLVPVEEVEDLHAVQRNLAILNAAGIHTEIPPRIVLPENPESTRRARQILAPFSEPPVAVHISMPLKKKRWPRERFAQLIEFIATKYSRQVLVMLDPHDSLHRTESLHKVLTRCVGVTVKPAGLLDLVALVASCREVIAHDGAIVHIAAGLDKPTLGIYVQENTQAYYPWGVPHVVLAGEVHAEDISVQSACDGYAQLQDLVQAR